MGFVIKHDQHASTSKQPYGTKIPKIMNQDMQRAMSSEVGVIIIEMPQFVGFLFNNEMKFDSKSHDDDEENSKDNVVDNRLRSILQEDKDITFELNDHGLHFDYRRSSQTNHDVGIWTTN